MHALSLQKWLAAFSLASDFLITLVLLAVLGASWPLATAIALLSTAISATIIYKKLKNNNGGLDE